MEQANLITTLDNAAPGFAAYASSEENLFPTDSPHGVFAACSQYVRETPRSPQVWRALAAVLNSAIGAGDDVDNAACTCFLENLANGDHPLAEHLRGSALEYWREWTGV